METRDSKGPHIETDAVLVCQTCRNVAYASVRADPDSMEPGSASTCDHCGRADHMIVLAAGLWQWLSSGEIAATVFANQRREHLLDVIHARADLPNRLRGIEYFEKEYWHAVACLRRTLNVLKRRRRRGVHPPSSPTFHVTAWPKIRR